MIAYINSSFGIRILLRFHGSALWKSLLPALISTAIYLFILSSYPGGEGELEDLFLHPYPMQALVTAFTFLLVFRANYSYNRWWEAYSAIYLMHSKWLDLATEIAAFHYQSKRYDAFKPPSFGANPSVQSLVTHPFEESAFEDSSNSASFSHPIDSFAFTPDGPITESPTRSRMNSNSTMHRPSKPHLPNTGLARHARSPTMNDLIQQMDAFEAEEKERNRQSLDAEEFDSNNNEGDEDAVGNKNNMMSINDANPNNDSVTKSNKEGTNRKRSWLEKVKERRSQSQQIRNSKRLEKERRRAESMSAANYANGSDKRHQKMKRRRTRHEISSNQPATERLYSSRKSIARQRSSALREREALRFCDRYDVKTGKPYSLFTAVSRKHLREGHLEPDEIPPLLFLEEVAHLLSLMSAVAFSTLRNDLPEAESPLTVFEPGLPWPQVDPDKYKGKVRKGWTSSKYRMYAVLQFILGRSRNDHARTLYNAARPFRVIGNVSDAEIERLQEARGPLAKVTLVSMWLMELVSREYQAGSTGAVAPPIISRIYQFVSDGLAGYNQARKIAYIPFPFPHAQITTLFMLVVDFFVTPLLMATFVTNSVLGFFLNFASVMCFTGLHEVAREIENPFQNVPNDVPLNNYQAQFNEGLMVMFYGYHPDAYWKEPSPTSSSVASNRPIDTHSEGPLTPGKTVDGDSPRTRNVNFVSFQSPNRKSLGLADDEREQKKNKTFHIPLGESVSMIQTTEKATYHGLNNKKNPIFQATQDVANSSKEGGIMEAFPKDQKIPGGGGLAEIDNIRGENFEDSFLSTIGDSAWQSSSSSRDSFRLLHFESGSFRLTDSDSRHEAVGTGQNQSSKLFRIPQRSADDDDDVSFHSPKPSDLSAVDERKPNKQA